MDLLTIDVLGAEECAAIVGALREAEGIAATVSGEAPSYVVNALVRKATRIAAPPAVRERVDAALARVMPRLAERFAVPLAMHEEPQFLRYRIGDYFVAHQDGNTPLIRDETRHRRVSAIILLSDPAAYDGGELLFHLDWPNRTAAPNARGSLLAFHSEQTHEVTPLTRGERFSIATWYR